MQGSSNNSFIPKRSNSKRQRTKPARKIFLITIIAYSLLFAALLAAGGTVFYKNYTSTQLEKEVILLNTAVNTFSVSDFKRVQEFNSTLVKAKDRVDNTVSVVAILDELDRVTAQPIQINDLELQRNADQNLSVIINFSTETLDAALFQRKILTANSVLFSDAVISEVNIQGAELNEEQLGAAPSVSFLAEFSIPLSSALYDPAEARRVDTGVNQTTGGPSVATSPSFNSPVAAESEIGSGDSRSDETNQQEEIESNETTI